MKREWAGQRCGAAAAGGEARREPAPGGPSFLQARRSSPLARLERDAWVQWPARVAPDLAAELGMETHTVQTALEAAVKVQLAELAELKPRFD